MKSIRSVWLPSEVNVHVKECGLPRHVDVFAENTAGWEGWGGVNTGS